MTSDMSQGPTPENRRAQPPTVLRVLLVGGTDQDYASVAAYLSGVNDGLCSLVWQTIPDLAVKTFANGLFDVALVDLALVGRAAYAWQDLLTHPLERRSTIETVVEDPCSRRQVVLFNGDDDAGARSRPEWLASLPTMGRFCPLTLDALLGLNTREFDCQRCVVSRQGLAQLEHLLDHAPVATMAIDERGRVLLWNAGAEALLGHQGPELLGHLPAALELSGEVSLLDRIHAIDAGPEPHVQRLRFKHKDGRAVTLRVTASHLSLEHYDLTVCHFDSGTMVELDPLDWYEPIGQVSRQLLAFIDTSLRCRAVNEAFARAFGAERAAMIGEMLADWLPSSVFGMVAEELSRCFVSGQLIAEHELLIPGRGRQTLEFVYSPSYNAVGKVNGAALVIRDVSTLEVGDRELAAVRQVQNAVHDLQTAFISNKPLGDLGHQVLRAVISLSSGIFAFLAERQEGVLVPSVVEAQHQTAEGCEGAAQLEGHDLLKSLATRMMERVGPVSRPVVRACTIRDLDATVDDFLPFANIIVLPVFEQGVLSSAIYVGTAKSVDGQTVLERLLPLLTTYESITSGYSARVRQQAAELRYRLLYDENPALLIELSAHGGIESVNKYGARLLGRQPSELAETNLLTLLNMDDVVFAGQIIDDLFHKGKETTVAELRFRHADGHSVWMRVAGRVISEGAEPRALLACKDISETRKLSDELAYHAAHDALTGLLNRREFERRLHIVFGESRHNQADGAMLLIDIDMFRLVNDAAGHKAGDSLLQAVASRLKSTLRTRDVVARVGGDEFAVLLSDCQEPQALRAAEDLLAALSGEPFGWQDREFTLQVHIGVVLLDGRVTDVGELLSTAEATCVEAKSAASGHIAFAAGETSALKRRREAMRMLDEIRLAMTENRLVLFQQVIKPTTEDDDDYHHCEILLRLKCNDGDLLPPGLFLPVAEQYRLMRELDQWVVDAVFRWFAERREVLNEIALCSINLSGQSVGDPEMQGFIRERCMIYRIPPSRFCFEVTETAVMEDIGRSINFIEALKRDGFRFAIDDFGSGLASFGYLKRLPVDYVKIDGMFVKDIEDDDTHAAIVASINQISKVMGKKTIAEFVENLQVAKKLQKIGVDYAQGYGMGRPEPIEMLEKRLGGGRASHLQLISDKGI